MRLLSLVFDIFLRGFIVSGGQLGKINISLTCLYLGSDSALDDVKKWEWGSFLTFIEALIFTIVMLTLETDDLHTMRTRRTASHLAYIMLCAFAANTGLYYYIKKKMEEPKDESANYDKADTNDVELAENAD